MHRLGFAACHKCRAVSCAGTPYRASRSYSNLGQLMSDSESTTPVAPSAASPALPTGHNRTVSAISDGSALNSPFGTQGPPQSKTDGQEHNQVKHAIAQEQAITMLSDQLLHNV